jgi:exonuclease SbcC
MGQEDEPVIKKLILHNFQSHRHSEVDFTEGINTIIGESDHGKTALFRAFQWVWKNNPSGMKFISHWATGEDRNGNPVITDTCYVTVVFMDDKYVTREKSHLGFNGYHIGSYTDGKFHREEDFAKIGTSVPFPIINMFNMEDVNIQNQHDSMFLLSETGQDVARYFNRLIKLDKADTALAISESKKRAAKKLVSDVESDMKETQESIDKLDWTEPAEKMVDKINFTDGKIDKIFEDVIDLEQMIENIIAAESKCVLPTYHDKAEMIIAKVDGLTDKINNLDNKIYDISVLEHDIRELTIKVRDSGWMKDANVFTKTIGNMDKDISSKTKSIIDLDDMINSIEACDSDIKLSDYSKKARIVITKIDEFDKNIYSVSDSIDEVDMMITKIQTLEAKIGTGSGSIAKLKRQLPDRCPTCNQPLKKEIA